ncbi:hypothetical protein [Sphingomonas solaris]|uniref:Uncharacterized protein n=1 Tax=Alterirhizorhabdus solaris TaxID=2529389 RepID=A0A558R2J5_9SPHN|nr:hypothetical protein [Sphingomonas solaris]TVV73590.1 hypothetical protein FOY91_11875 [Sphingomonas solaris]
MWWLLGTGFLILAFAGLGYFVMVRAVVGEMSAEQEAEAPPMRPQTLGYRFLLRWDQTRKLTDKSAGDAARRAAARRKARRSLRRREWW